MTSFFDLVKRESREVGRKIVVTAAVSGLANAAVLAIINEAAHTGSNGTPSHRYFMMFVVAMTLYIACLQYSSRAANRVMIDVVHRIRTRVTAKVQQSELLALEAIGKNRIINAISQESTTIADSGGAMIGGLQAAVVVVFASIYIAFLSIPAFVLTLVTAGVAISIVQQSRSVSRRWMQATKRREIEFLNYATDAIDGFKEAKLSRKKSHDLQRDLERCSSAITKLRFHAENLMTTNTIQAQSGFYVLIASVVFLLPQFIPTYEAVIVEITTSILFITGPLRLIIGLLPYLAVCDEATRAIVYLEQALDKRHAVENGGRARPPVSLPFQSVALTDVRFAYKRDGAEVFALGPLSFAVSAGEIVFIIGGNGSGKSTLLKVLSGLYPLDSGSLTVDDVRVGQMDIQSYREMYSAVFADFHLFRRLYGLLGTDPELVKDLLKEMQLEKKVGFSRDRFTTLDLSTGQRKRLALIVSLLDRKPILLFDELAADQDPGFRGFLYEELLPHLKSQGATVIAATHDDRYFHVADKVIKMEFGKVVHVRG